MLADSLDAYNVILIDGTISNGIHALQDRSSPGLSPPLRSTWQVPRSQGAGVFAFCLCSVLLIPAFWQEAVSRGLPMIKINSQVPAVGGSLGRRETAL